MTPASTARKNSGCSPRAAYCAAVFCSPPGPTPGPAHIPKSLLEPCMTNTTASAIRSTTRPNSAIRALILLLEIERHAARPHRSLMGKVDVAQAWNDRAARYRDLRTVGV